MTVYLAIFKDADRTVVIEYRPCYDTLPGAIEILSIHIEPRPRSAWQIREAERRKHPRRLRRGLVLDEQEQQAEAMRPTTRLEQMNLW